MWTISLIIAILGIAFLSIYLTTQIEEHPLLKLFMLVFSIFMMVLSTAVGLKILDIKSPDGLSGLLSSMNVAYWVVIIFMIVVISYLVIYFIYKTLKAIKLYKKSQEPSYENYKI